MKVNKKQHEEVSPREDAARAFPEYELAGIETIARGICLTARGLLVCRARGAATCYLPGGHIEFGETGREALAREMTEETGRTATVGRFRGVVENRFLQHGKPHAEINLVYEMTLDSENVVSREAWIGFEWMPPAECAARGLLPEVFRRLADDTNILFTP